MNKINILLATFVMTLGLNSCAHHDNAVSHHHHEEAPKKASYEGKCAYSVENKNFDVQGNPEFNIEHDGILYYFSSEQNDQPVVLLPPTMFRISSQAVS